MKKRFEPRPTLQGKRMLGPEGPTKAFAKDISNLLKKDISTKEYYRLLNIHSMALADQLMQAQESEEEKRQYNTYYTGLIAGLESRVRDIQERTRRGAPRELDAMSREMERLLQQPNTTLRADRDRDNEIIYLHRELGEAIEYNTNLARGGTEDLGDEADLLHQLGQLSRLYEINEIVQRIREPQQQEQRIVPFFEQTADDDPHSTPIRTQVPDPVSIPDDLYTEDDGIPAVREQPRLSGAEEGRAEPGAYYLPEIVMPELPGFMDLDKFRIRKEWFEKIKMLASSLRTDIHNGFQTEDSAISLMMMYTKGKYTLEPGTLSIMRVRRHWNYDTAANADYELQQQINTNYRQDLAHTAHDTSGHLYLNYLENFN